MKMWSVDVLILLLFCYTCLSTANGKVYFASKNFHNMLHWDPVDPTTAGEKVLYSVQYQNYSEMRFQIKQECQNITALTCDLTAETPSGCDAHYQAKVLVNGRMLGLTARFTPIAETTLGALNLSTYATVSSLFLNATLPLGPNGISLADIISNSKSGPSETVIEYTLKITEPKWAVLVNESTTGRFVINLKNNGTKYCGHVVYKPSSEWGRPESEEALFCVTLPDNPSMLLPWLLGLAALLVAALTVSVVWMCSYVKGGKKTNMPQSLVNTSGIPNQQVLQSSDGRILISTVVVSRPSDKKASPVFCGYSPQDIPFEAWQGSAGTSEDSDEHSPTLTDLERSGQSSDIYSSVAVHVPADESKDVQQATTDDTQTRNLPSSSGPWHRGGLKPMSLRVPPSPDLDSESNAAIPLLLHTVRDTNGQLVLPSLTYQLQKPLLSALTDSKEERPLLTSLHSFDSSDSGCDDTTINTPVQSYVNSHYVPSQAHVPHFNLQCQNAPSSDAVFESGYKQNWMPANLHEAASKDISEYRRTNCHWNWTPPKEDEEEEEECVRDDDGGEERSRHIVLGSWMIQIQE